MKSSRRALWSVLAFGALAAVLVGVFANDRAPGRSGEPAPASRTAAWPKLTGPYLGQKPPGTAPEVFAPGIVSKGYDERMAFFTPDGKELYYQLRGAPHTVAVHMKEEFGAWSHPETAFFSGRYFSEFALSPDGNKIVYCSNQPESDQGPPSDLWRTWMVERTEEGWDRPRDLGVETAYPTISSRGDLYFFRYRHGRTGDGQLFMSAYRDGAYTDAVDIGDPDNEINTVDHEVDPFIAPDESYLIFASNRPGGYGEADLYICFRRADGTWTKARNMGPSINTKAVEFCPSVSPDGRHIFFASDRTLYPAYSEKPLTYADKLRILDGPGNGSCDIYWVSAEVIDGLRPSSSPGRTMSEVSQDTLTDIDGNAYRTVKIGDRVWMAENLRVTRDRGGNPIPSYCYDDQKTNCEKSGRLYTWDVALKAAPDGWHLPTDAEWQELVDDLGGRQIAGTKLLVGGSSGFGAILAGGADFRGNYLYVDEYALFWSSTEVDRERAYHQDVGRDGTSNHFAAKKGARVSVRCVKNSS